MSSKKLEGLLMKIALFISYYFSEKTDLYTLDTKIWKKKFQKMYIYFNLMKDK